MIHLDQLELLIEAVHKGSFSAAARAKGKSISTVSAGISQLENQLGVTLFDRSTKYPKVTSEGKKVYKSALLLLKQVHKMDSTANDWIEEIEEAIVVGVDELVTPVMIESELSKMAQRYPNTRLELTRADRVSLAKNLQRGKIDIAITSNPATGNSLNTSNMSLVAITPKNDDSADSNNGSTVESLKPQTLIVCKGLDSFIELDAIKSTFSVKNQWTTTTLEDLFSLVAEGFGWGIVPYESTQEPHHIDKVDVIHLNELISNEPISIIVRKQTVNPTGPVVKYLLDLLESR